MSAVARRRARGARRPAADSSPSLALGFLAALPLFLAYELGLSSSGSRAVRSSAELVVGRVLFLFGERAGWARVALLAIATSLAWLRLRRGVRARSPEAPALARELGFVLAWGLVAGLLLGPLLVALQGLLDAGALQPSPEPPRPLSVTLRLIGAAPWEELCFRVGVYGGLYFAVRHALGFLGLELAAARIGAELVALFASASAFALFHLDAVQRLLGQPGEIFEGGLFLWRVSAGILLAGLFRWKGFGVAAWAHAVFNFGIAFGIVPL